jgi:hypothetical protein
VETLRAEGLPQAVGACQIVPAALGESIGDYAAICAAIDQAGPGAGNVHIPQVP